MQFTCKKQPFTENKPLLVGKDFPVEKSRGIFVLTNQQRDRIERKTGLNVKIR